MGPDRIFVRGHLGSKGTSSGVEIGQAVGTDWTIEDGRVRRMEWSFEVDELLARPGPKPAPRIAGGCASRI